MWGVVFGLRASVYIFGFGGSLTPDTGLYARGEYVVGNSLLASTLGRAMGLLGVQLLGVVGAVALGACLGAWSARWWVPAALALSPPGWYAMQAAADAAGAVAALCAYKLGGSRRERLWAVAPVAAVHLESGVVLALVSAYRGRGRWEVAAAGCAGLAGCLLVWHWQSRYLLPGWAIASILLR